MSDKVVGVFSAPTVPRAGRCVEFQKSDPDACKEACVLALKYVFSDGAKARVLALAEGKLQGSLFALEARVGPSLREVKGWAYAHLSGPLPPFVVVANAG